MTKNTRTSLFWMFFVQLGWIVATIEYYHSGQIDLPGLDRVYGPHAYYLIAISAPIVFVVIPIWLFCFPGKKTGQADAKTESPTGLSNDSEGK